MFILYQIFLQLQMVILMYFVQQVKTELEHFRTHQARQCTRCKDLLSVIQHHAQRCQMRGTCRVPGCESNRYVHVHYAHRQLFVWKSSPQKTVSLQWISGSFLASFLGSKGGAVVRALASHQCGPGSNPGVDAICELSLLLVLSLAPRGFSPGTPVFFSP